MNRLSFLFAGACALAAVSSSGCSAAPAPTASTLAGSVAQASFPKAVSAITVKSDSGKTSTVSVGADGRFSVPLEKGASYQLFLGADGKSIPVVLRSDQARLQTRVHVKSGGASLNIGSVRYWGGVSTSEAKVVAGPTTGAKSCVGGVFANTSQPCASGTAAALCGEGDDEESDGNNDGEHTDEQGADPGADCVDGLDATTKQPCDGGPAANPTDADAASEIGVPELNLSGDLGCGEEGDDGEGAD